MLYRDILMTQIKNELAASTSKYIIQDVSIWKKSTNQRQMSFLYDTWALETLSIAVQEHEKCVIKLTRQYLEFKVMC